MTGRCYPLETSERGWRILLSGLLYWVVGVEALLCSVGRRLNISGMLRDLNRALEFDLLGPRVFLLGFPIFWSVRLPPMQAKKKLLTPASCRGKSQAAILVRVHTTPPTIRLLKQWDCLAVILHIEHLAAGNMPGRNIPSKCNYRP